MEPPEGFRRHFRRTPLTDAWEPIYSRRGPKWVVLGLYVRDFLCNLGGTLHGGCVATLADEAMGLNSGIALIAQGWKPERNLLTVSLAVDYIKPASLGQWLAFETSFVETGKTLCFAQAFITANGDTIARADARYRVR